MSSSGGNNKKQNKIKQKQQHQRSEKGDSAPFNWGFFALWYIPLQLLTAWFLEMGAPFFIGVCLYLVLAHTSSSSSTSTDGGEKISAYSVFNPGVKRLDGSLRAEHFEREFKYSTASGKS